MINRFLAVCTVLYVPFGLLCFALGERQVRSFLPQ
jgi:hypothetical protein